MKREFLLAKIHRATITHSNLHYTGSLTIDEELLEKSGIAPNERVHVFNISNGQRFETYALKGEKGSREIGLNGAAARLGVVGDSIIIVAYCYLAPEEIPGHSARVLILGPGNVIEESFES
ncbi:MAG: aspartate 1-decarboxylase [Calditrichia bacterium]